MMAKSARDDREQYWTEIATAEQASNVGGTGKPHQIIRQVGGKLSIMGDSVHDATGDLIADNPNKTDHWRKHFEHLGFDEQPITPLLPSAAEFYPSPTYEVSSDTPPLWTRRSRRCNTKTAQQSIRNLESTSLVSKFWRPRSVR
ncbi:hypothetical protein SprV_0200919600 [Sparganum proliferum]